MASEKAKALISSILRKKKKSGEFKKNPKQSVAIALSEAREKFPSVSKKKD